MSDTGWIKIHRKIYDNPYASDPHWVALWVWMLCRATRTERRARIGKTTKTVTLQPGQFISGRKQMAKETGINESKINRILGVMKSEQQIEQHPSPAGSVFTVLNWESHQKVNNERTTSEQQVNTKQECKNIRSIYKGLFDEFPNLNTDEFRDAWERKMEHRKERKDKAWAKSTIQTRFKQFSEWGHDAAIQAINDSIANNYQGIFKPKGSNAKTRSNRDAGTLNDGTIDRANDELF